MFSNRCFRYAASLLISVVLIAPLSAQTPSVARQWNEVMLQAIRRDFARPPVQARNLFHVSVAMYDAWAVYDTVAKPYLLGNKIGNFTCPFDGVPKPADVEAARREAISYAVFRILLRRYQASPDAANTLNTFRQFMTSLGYNPNFTNTDYKPGSPAAMGNYIGKCVLDYGIQDGSNETNNYTNTDYLPVNQPLLVSSPAAFMIDPNRWQPLRLALIIDQNGNPISSNTQVFQSPEWGRVVPFALDSTDRKVNVRNGKPYPVYHDPGAPPLLNINQNTAESEEYKWNFSLVGIWGAQLDPQDTVMWDISPRTQGNTPPLPETVAGLRDFYKMDGGDYGKGYAVNPSTGQPYAPQIVRRGDYVRVVAEFWADGPTSETPPGHWYSVLNKVNDHPKFIKRFNGKGSVLGNLEWDVKAYFTLGGAVHDAAIAAWGIKGWYDGVRPISALRYMAQLGQSTDPLKLRYHPGGIKLVPGFIEQVEAGDPLAGTLGEHIGKIKLYTWRGPGAVVNPATDVAGVGWILAERWMPYQRPTFVTPPFAGYISGHSTYSRSAAEVMTLLTGDAYFPGGLGEYTIPANKFLAFEKGPSQDMTLQWATYRDASNQASLSRIWGGIHPPFDDIPGRRIGIVVGTDAFSKARTYFYRDEDKDGFYSYEDCDDRDSASYPGAPELCDGKDNNCDNQIDEGLPIRTYYVDTDKDGYGNVKFPLDTCLLTAPVGYASNALDCDDANAAIYPGAPESCDGIDNNCNGLVDDGLPRITYYRDRDADGFGDAASPIDTCQNVPPAGCVTNKSDCNDNNAAIRPTAPEICDGIDNNCNGLVDDGLPRITYYRDRDADGFGDAASTIDTCQNAPPAGYVTNKSDCNDNNAAIRPTAPEICDGIDNNCNGLADDGLPRITYYRDRDADGFGDAASTIDTCRNVPPTGYVVDNTDCNDTDAGINPAAREIADNGVDEDCSGVDLFLQTKLFPNPVRGPLTVHYNHQGSLQLHVIGMDGKLMRDESVEFTNNSTTVDLADLAPGLYVLKFIDVQREKVLLAKVAKVR